MRRIMKNLKDKIRKPLRDCDCYEVKNIYDKQTILKDFV